MIADWSVLELQMTKREFLKSFLLEARYPESPASHCTFALSLFSLLRRLPQLKRSFISELSDHAANMNSESAQEQLKLLNSALVCSQGKRKDM